MELTIFQTMIFKLMIGFIWLTLIFLLMITLLSLSSLVVIMVTLVLKTTLILYLSSFVVSITIILLHICFPLCVFLKWGYDFLNSFTNNGLCNCLLCQFYLDFITLLLYHSFLLMKVFSCLSIS